MGALVVWGYALAWFLVSDRVKLLAYRFFDPAKIKMPIAATPRLAMTPLRFGATDRQGCLCPV